MLKSISISDKTMFSPSKDVGHGGAKHVPWINCHPPCT